MSLIGNGSLHGVINKLKEKEPYKNDAGILATITSSTSDKIIEKIITDAPWYINQTKNFKTFDYALLLKCITVTIQDNNH